jgi:hypothetical protein
MDWLSTGGNLLLAIGAFIAGWLTSTEKTRIEVYKKRLDAYLETNRLAADLFHLVLKNSIDTQTSFGPMVEARLALAKFFVANAVIVSEEVGKHVSRLVEAQKEPSVEEIRLAFNALIHQMAKELKFEQIHSVNETLLSTIPSKRSGK